MKISQTYRGTIIGILFTIGSLLLTLTFFVPILSMLLGAHVESLVTSVIGGTSYTNIGIATISIFSLVFVGSLIGIYIKSKKTIFQTSTIVKIMALEYFIIHTLGFYIYWAIALNFTNDGQLIFAAIDSFPISSFGFIFLGLFIDFLRHNSLNFHPRLGIINESEPFA